VTPSNPGPNGQIFIVSAARTPIGKFGGALSNTPAVELGGVAIAAAVERGLPPEATVDEVLMGQVLQAGVGQAPARKAALLAGLPACFTARSVSDCVACQAWTAALGVRRRSKACTRSRPSVIGSSPASSCARTAASIKRSTSSGSAVGRGRAPSSVANIRRS
jgi:acetyl-CoA C-acetyltransferase